MGNWALAQILQNSNKEISKLEKGRVFKFCQQLN